MTPEEAKVAVSKIVEEMLESSFTVDEDALMACAIEVLEIEAETEPPEWLSEVCSDVLIEFGLE